MNFDRLLSRAKDRYGEFGMKWYYKNQLWEASPKCKKCGLSTCKDLVNLGMEPLVCRGHKTKEVEAKPVRIYTPVVGGWGA